MIHYEISLMRMRSWLTRTEPGDCSSHWSWRAPCSGDPPSLERSTWSQSRHGRSRRLSSWLDLRPLALADCQLGPGLDWGEGEGRACCVLSLSYLSHLVESYLQSRVFIGLYQPMSNLKYTTHFLVCSRILNIFPQKLFNHLKLQFWVKIIFLKDIS